MEEINAAGGVNGKKIEVITRDDGGKPERRRARGRGADQRARKSTCSTGTFLSNVGLAVADFAMQKKLFFLAGEPLTDAIVWDKGNRYTFRLRPGTYMQAAMLVEEAAKLTAKRWADRRAELRVRPVGGGGFKQLLKAAQPDVEFVAEQCAGAGQGRCRRDGAGAGRRQARCDLQRDLRRRPLEVRA